jgi:hypothetical protein
MKLTSTELIIGCLIILALVYVLFGRDHVEHLTLPTVPAKSVVPPATPAGPSAGNIQAAIAALNTPVTGNVPTSPGGLNTNPIAMPAVAPALPVLGATSGVMAHQPTIGALNTNVGATSLPLGGMANIANAVARPSTTTTLPGLNNPARAQVAGSTVKAPPVPGIVPPTPAPPLKLPAVPATPVRK